MFFSFLLNKNKKLLKTGKYLPQCDLFILWSEYNKDVYGTCMCVQNLSFFHFFQRKKFFFVFSKNDVTYLYFLNKYVGRYWGKCNVGYWYFSFLSLVGIHKYFSILLLFFFESQVSVCIFWEKKILLFWKIARFIYVVFHFCGWTNSFSIPEIYMTTRR